MKGFVLDYLTKLNYEIGTDAFAIMEICDNWYANREIEEFHVRKNINNVEYRMKRMNFAKRCCADDANLCEIIAVTPKKSSEGKAFIQTLFERNNFDTMYRQQLEKMTAEGTVGAYIYLDNAQYIAKEDGSTIVKGGTVKINYVDPDCIIPLTIIDEKITEAAFASTNTVKGKEQTTLVIFSKQDDGLYEAQTIVFDDAGRELPELTRNIVLGDIKPFSIMRTAQVNNIDKMKGYGLPKVYHSIPIFMAIDLCYNLFHSDLKKGEKMVLLNEALCEFTKDGKPTREVKEIFVLLGEKLPEEKTLYQEYNPQIRVEEITKAFELALSLVSMQFGYGSKKYTFENGQIKTATEYIGERQDCMQELNKQRKQSEGYVKDIIRAAMWFENQFNSAHYDTDEELTVDFDDSYIEDKQAKIERIRNDAVSFDIPEIKIRYFMEAYNLTEKEAKAWAEQESNRTPDEEEED